MSGLRSQLLRPLSSWRREGCPAEVIGLNQTQPDLHPQRGKHVYLDVQGEPHSRRGYIAVFLATIYMAAPPVREEAAPTHRALSSPGATKSFVQVQSLIQWSEVGPSGKHRVSFRKLENYLTLAEVL